MYTVDINKLRRVTKAYRLRREWNKVFGIGSHKTGTTTLDFILDALGFNCAPQQKLEKECTLELRTGNYYPLRKYIDRFDFFQDSPFAHAHHYVALDALYPRSKFIYTYRDPEEWYESNLAFVSKWCNVPKGELPSKAHYNKYGYISDDYMLLKTEYYEIQSFCTDTLTCKPDWSLLFDKTKFIDSYTQRRDEIFRYFSHRPQDFLSLELGKEEDIRKIALFLDLPPFINFLMPRLNSGSQSDNTRLTSDSQQLMQSIENLD